MSKTLIRTNRLGKRYRLGTSVVYHHEHLELMAEGPQEIDSKPVEGRARIQHGWIWALQNLSVEVSEGDVLGIVGANGAGKSTFLKLLSRITAPTVGTADVYGRMSSLLEIGTGFNWELTGRENIYLNGLVLGMTRREIQARFDEIVDFAGTEEFIDTPMKRYSSGMVARLGFAVAAHLEANILVVDEVLAVGDIAFQRKCIARMRALAGQQGRAVLFVSHNAETVLDTCTRAIWLKDGELAADGAPRDVLMRYLSTEGGAVAAHDGLNADGRSGRGYLRITGCEVVSGDTGGGEAIVGGPMVIRLEFQTMRSDLTTLSFGIQVRDGDGRIITNLSTRARRQDFDGLKDAGIVECRIDRCPFRPGAYSLAVEVTWVDVVVDSLPHAFKFNVLPGRFFESGLSQSSEALVFVDHSWSSGPIAASNHSSVPGAIK